MVIAQFHLKSSDSISWKPQVKQNTPKSDVSFVACVYVRNVAQGECVVIFVGERRVSNILIRKRLCAGIYREASERERYCFLEKTNGRTQALVAGPKRWLILLA
jgi:hypothetical protein